MFSGDTCWSTKLKVKVSECAIKNGRAAEFFKREDEVQFLQWSFDNMYEHVKSASNRTTEMKSSFDKLEHSVFIIFMS